MARHRLSRVFAGSLLAGALTLGATTEWSSTVVAQQPPFRWQGQLAAGQTIEVRGINGDIRATGVPGADAEVTAVKHARRSDPNSVRINVEQHGDGVTICAVYPTTGGSQPNDCRQGSGNGVRDNDVQVDFTVRVPVGVNLVARTVNGGIAADATSANADLKTVNGAVQFSTAGYGQAETVNGSITASLQRADWTEPLEFRTVNGGITVDLPADTNAEVHARVVNGSITSDFPMVVSGRLDPRRANLKLGSGGRRLDVQTVNGSIELRRTQ
ncbi:MAG: DUF4097 family beta strand repeat-containing protein [Vicinamibacterales bacterium]